MTALFERLVQMHRLDDEGWERHANPLSGATRMVILPLLTLILFARGWFGWWTIPLTLALIAWTLVNPRAFPRPRHTTHWMSRAVMGERVLLNADTVPVPDHHRVAARRLSWIAGVGLPALIWGVLVLNPWATLLGLGLTLLGKLWFLDRMVWLYDDMARTTDQYRAWQRP